MFGEKFVKILYLIFERDEEGVGLSIYMCNIVFFLFD